MLNTLKSFTYLLFNIMILEDNLQQKSLESGIVPQNNQERNWINEQMLQKFSSKIRACFPTFVASVMADRHGFVIHAEKGDNVDEFDEDMLALTTICEKRKIMDLSHYHKLIKPLNKNVKLLVLLEKSRINYVKCGEFEEILRKENPLE